MMVFVTTHHATLASFARTRQTVSNSITEKWIDPERRYATNLHAGLLHLDQQRIILTISM